MTENKPIMIDGVDVSECEAYKPYLGKYDCIALGNKSSATCKGSPNCLYKQLALKTQECEKLEKYLNKIRDEELSHLDIEWDEYETSARQEDYSNIITLVERALGEIDD